jgi:hypothetical protein
MRDEGEEALQVRRMKMSMIMMELEIVGSPRRALARRERNETSSPF